MPSTQTDDIAGWRFIIKYTEPHEPEEVREYPCHFMSPDRDTCAANVRYSFELWKGNAAIISVEWQTPIFKKLGWGDGAWTEAFK